MHESIVFCSECTMSSVRKFTFAISSLDAFLDTSMVKSNRHVASLQLTYCAVIL